MNSKIVWVNNESDLDCVVVIKPDHTIESFIPSGNWVVQSTVQLDYPIEYIKLDLNIGEEIHAKVQT